jgi:hydroxymethylbilane synthase
MSSEHPVFLATRGSALALTQTRLVLKLCRAAFPGIDFDIRIIKTTGDRLQTTPPDAPGVLAGKGLFTKELEIALIAGEADMAVHSLKDLPTELPDRLALGAVLPRADVRDVFIYRGKSDEVVARLAGGQPGTVAASSAFGPGAGIDELPEGAVIGTGSTRRQAQLNVRRPDLRFDAIRGNVGTRLKKLAAQPELDGLVLAAAGLERLGFLINDRGWLECEPQGGSQTVIQGIRATMLSIDEMLPCVGQGAIGLEIRKNDPRLEEICARLNDPDTMRCVLAERAFLRAMGGGCLSPVAALAEVNRGKVRLRAVSFDERGMRRTERVGDLDDGEAIGAQAGEDLKKPENSN